MGILLVQFKDRIARGNKQDKGKIVLEISKETHIVIL